MYPRDVRPLLYLACHVLEVVLRKRHSAGGLWGTRGSGVAQGKAVVAAAGTNGHSREDRAMLRLALLFLVVALIAALFGFVGVASVSMEAARIFFFVFIVLAVL